MPQQMPPPLILQLFVAGISFFTECSNVNFGPHGSQYVANSQKTSEHLGLNHLILVTSDEVSQLFPYLRIPDGNQCVVQLTNCGMVNPRKQILAQKTAAQMQGCHIVSDVVQVIIAIPSHHLQMSSTTTPPHTQTCKMLELRTESGEIFHARRVLLCTGAFTHFGSLLPEGVEIDLRLAPNQTLRLEMSGEDEARLRNMPTVCSMTRDSGKADCYICPPVVYPDGKNRNASRH